MSRLHELLFGKARSIVNSKDEWSKAELRQAFGQKYRISKEEYELFIKDMKEKGQVSVSNSSIKPLR